MCGGFTLDYFTRFLKSVKLLYPNVQKRIVLISNDSTMNIYDEYENNNITIEVRHDNELSMIPLNKVDILQKYIDKNSDYSIFINPNALFLSYNNELLLSDSILHFGYIDNSEQEEHFAFGSLIFGPTPLFNKLIKFARDYEFQEDENRTDEQKFIRFIEENSEQCDYYESSNIYQFIETH